MQVGCGSDNVFFQFTAPGGRTFNLSSLWTYKTNGPLCNKFHNFGFVFNRKMQWKEEQKRGMFVIYILLETQEANSFVDVGVRERRDKFWRGNF